MTSLIAWIGVDRQPASLYFASDSRLTWSDYIIDNNFKVVRKTPPVRRWESGRKLFASQRTADIFGFFGDSEFPSQVLATLIDLIDSGVLLQPSQTAQERHQIVCEVISTALQRQDGRIAPDKFTIYHGARDKEKMICRFWLFSFAYADGKWTHNEKQIDYNRSTLLLVKGTGTAAVSKAIEAVESTGLKGTTRAIFKGFCDSLASNLDPYSGGAPQLIGLYRIKQGLNFGTVWNEKPYLYGLPASKHFERAIHEWRNEGFELVDPATLRRRLDAKIHLFASPMSS